MTSDVSLRSERLVAERSPQAADLGRRLALLVDDPDGFVAVLREGLGPLADPAHARSPVHRSPASGPVIGVRQPLLRIIARAVRRALGEGSSASALWLAQRLIGEDAREVRLLVLPALEHGLLHEPERTWQLLRRLGRTARDWVEVDSQADLWARGILAEPFRWAEVEQLAYSDRAMERRLVGSTLAVMPRSLPGPARASLAGDAGRALDLVRMLVGDADHLVGRALAWALREWAQVDRGAVERVLSAEAAIASEHLDGHRAAVVRAALPAIDSATAARMRMRLAGTRRMPAAPSTSLAAARAASFGAPAALSDIASVRQGARYAGATA